jgi:succinate dehydrogenase / fumarate reductase membrane anchor subunit
MDMVKRIIVGAHYGLRDWLTQRVSAAYMALYTAWFVILLLVVRPTNFVAWRSLFAAQPMKLATFLFLVSLFLHAWIGVRDILMDYVKPTGVRLTAYVVVIAWLLACAGWALQILWSV